MKLIQLLVTFQLIFISYSTILNNEVKSRIITQLEDKKEARILIQFKLKDVQIDSNNKQISSLLNLHEELITHNQQSYKTIESFISKNQQLGTIKDIKFYFISNTILITIKDKQILNELLNYKNIIEISLNQQFKLNLPQVETRNERAISWDGKKPHWSLVFINATNISSEIKYNASKLVYANADSGLDYLHPAINNNYLGKLDNNTYNHNYHWWDGNKVKSPERPNGRCGINTQAPCYDSDHGTHTMSTTIGGLNLGVSSTTKWIACKNMDQGYGTPESYLSCLQFLLAPTDLNGNNPKPELRPHVVGNSYGCPTSEGCSSTTFNQALITLKQFGIFMSVSAGNDGYSGCSTINSPPASDPNSFTVASSDYKSFDRSYFSSMGPVVTRQNAIDVTAPGSNIMGAIPGGKYKELDGTSMAAPHVAGAALLVMAACPKLERDVEKVQYILRTSATPVYSNEKCGGDTNKSYPNNEYGYGVINIAKAIQLCQSIN